MPRYPMLSDRHNIVVIADEAHRTQYGFEARLKVRKENFKPNQALALDTQALTATNIVAIPITTGSGTAPAYRAEFAPPTYRAGAAANTAEHTREHYQVGYAQHLRDALPNATFVAFTGTGAGAGAG